MCYYDSNNAEMLQDDINAECLRIAQSNNLTNAYVAGPIFDGVPDEELYLKSWPRVLWILQEPHDNSASEKVARREIGLYQKT